MARPRTDRRRLRRALRVAAPLTLAAFVLTGCDGATWWRGGLPSPVTKQAHRVLTFWQGSLIAAFSVGFFVMGLILWSALRFRRKSDQLPRQVRYNLPIEVIYTAAPIIIISYMFYFTATTENYENKLTKNPDVTIGVVGFQWSWQFNYYGENLQVTGRPGQPPQLVLPVGKTVRFVETSPDVIHSFWVIPFLFKRDVVPGRINQFEVTIDKQGTFVGRCAEYCGVDHDRMLFSVKAVSDQDYRSFLQQASAQAQTGKSDTFALIPTASTGSTP